MEFVYFVRVVLICFKREPFPLGFHYKMLQRPHFLNLPCLEVVLSVFGYQPAVVRITGKSHLLHLLDTWMSPLLLQLLL